MISSFVSKIMGLFCGLSVILSVLFYPEPSGWFDNLMVSPAQAPFSIQNAALPQSQSLPNPDIPVSVSTLPLPYYLLKVEFDPRVYFAGVQEKIVYTNRSGQNLDQIIMVVEANHSPGIFSLKNISLDDELNPPSFSLEQNILEITLPETLITGQKITINLDYTLDLPEKAVLLGYTTHQSNFIDWYPYIPPYQNGQGWVVNPAGRVGEHLSFDLADFVVDVRFPDKTPLQMIAAPVPEQSFGTGIKRFYHSAARNFYMSISPVYKTVTSQVQDVNVTGYVFPEHVDSGESAATYTADAIQYYSSLFTPYQHKHFTFVEVDFADGMEGDGIFFLNKNYFAYTNGPTSGLCALSAHETAHQWWFAQVGNNPALNPWLDESLATYMELMYYRHYYPELTDWWWQYRIYAFNPTGNIAGTIYDFQSYRPYVNAVYLHGVLFLDAVYQKMGQESFVVFLKQYAEKFYGQQATPEEFFYLLFQYSQVDLQPTVDEYFNP